MHQACCGDDLVGRISAKIESAGPAANRQVEGPDVYLGLELTVPIEQKAIAGKTVHSIGAGTLIVCLAPQITAAEVEPLALGIVEWYKQLAPAGESTVVFRDSAFADDVAKTNLTAILQQHELENVRSL
jgi:adenine-specific DNA-methyltransferase